MLDVAYICNQKRECMDHVSCQKDCKRTHDPTYALCDESIELISNLLARFDIIGDAKLVEKEK